MPLSTITGHYYYLITHWSGRASFYSVTLVSLHVESVNIVHLKLYIQQAYNALFYGALVQHTLMRK